MNPESISDFLPTSYYHPNLLQSLYEETPIVQKEIKDIPLTPAYIANQNRKKLLQELEEKNNSKSTSIQDV